MTKDSESKTLPKETSNENNDCKAQLVFKTGRSLLPRGMTHAGGARILFLREKKGERELNNAM